jgi:hypothetical protein
MPRGSRRVCGLQGCRSDRRNPQTRRKPRNRCVWPHQLMSQSARVVRIVGTPHSQCVCDKRERRPKLSVGLVRRAFCPWLRSLQRSPCEPLPVLAFCRAAQSCIGRRLLRICLPKLRAARTRLRRNRLSGGVSSGSKLRAVPTYARLVVGSRRDFSRAAVRRLDSRSPS